MQRKNAFDGSRDPHQQVALAVAAGEDDCYQWLKRSFDTRSEEFAGFVAHAHPCNERLRQYAVADPADRTAPRFDQGWFGGLDAALAYSFVRAQRPGRIMEVGSGQSTRFLRRAIVDGRLAAHLHSIDPRPRREIDALCDQITRTRVETCPPALFAQLAAGDLLFIDGSHIALPGTDVDFLFHEALPLLAPGVWIHVHDVFLPHGYPAEWSSRYYNEQSVLLGMLSGGDRYRVVCPVAYLRRYQPQIVEHVFAPRLAGYHESSLWLRVISGA